MFGLYLQAALGEGFKREQKKKKMQHLFFSIQALSQLKITIKSKGDKKKLPLLLIKAKLEENFSLGERKPNGPVNWPQQTSQVLTALNNPYMFSVGSLSHKQER